MSRPTPFFDQPTRKIPGTKKGADARFLCVPGYAAYGKRDFAVDGGFDSMKDPADADGAFFRAAFPSCRQRFFSRPPAVGRAEYAAPARS